MRCPACGVGKGASDKQLIASGPAPPHRRRQAVQRTALVRPGMTESESCVGNKTAGRGKSPPGRETLLPVFSVVYLGGAGAGTMLRTGGRDMR